MGNMREKLESLNLATLKDLAKHRGVKGSSTMKKADLIQSLLKLEEAQQGAASAAPAEPAAAQAAQPAASAAQPAASAALLRTFLCFLSAFPLNLKTVSPSIPR